jgi:hypothetical protein
MTVGSILNFEPWRVGVPSQPGILVWGRCGRLCWQLRVMFANVKEGWVGGRADGSTVWQRCPLTGVGVPLSYTRGQCWPRQAFILTCCCHYSSSPSQQVPVGMTGWSLSVCCSWCMAESAGKYNVQQCCCSLNIRYVCGRERCQSLMVMVRGG